MTNPGLIIRIAANTAELKKNLAEVTGNIETTTAGMKKLASSLDGNKLIQNAHNIVAAVNEIGGATKLTEAEKARLNVTLQKAIDKYQVLGTEAPKAMRDLAAATGPVEQKLTLAGKAGQFLVGTFGQMVAAFSVSNLIAGATSTLVGWTKEAFTSAGAVVDMADKTGLSTEAIQRMAYVAGQTGSSVEAMTDAAFKLGVRLSGGSNSVRAAVGELGMAFSDLRSLRPDEQFERIVSVLGQIQNEQERNRLGVELFGKTYEQIAASVAGDYARLAQDAAVSGDKQIRALDDVGDAWERLKNRAKQHATEILGGFAQQLEEGMKNWDRAGARAARIRAGLLPDDTNGRSDIELHDPPAQVQRGAPDYLRILADAKAAVAALTGAQREQLDAALKIGKADGELLEHLGLSDAALKLYTDGQTLAAQATKKTADEVARLNTEWNRLATASALSGVKGESTLALIASNMAAQGITGRPASASLVGPDKLVGSSLLSKFAGSRLLEMYGAGMAPNVAPYDVDNISGRMGGGGGSFFGNMTGGVKDLWKGMSGGNGMSGLMSNLGGDLLTGGMNSLMNAGMSLAMKGIGKLFGGLFGGEGKRTNDARDKGITDFTGIADLGQAQDQLRKMAAEAGVTGAEMAKLFDTKKQKVFEQAFADVTGKIKEQQEIVAKYNLTWVDFAGPRRAEEFKKALGGVTKDTEALERAGLSHTDALKKTADAYVELARQGIAAGEGIEPALAPVLQQLADMGLLTDDMVSALSGVASDGLPTWQEMEKAAEKYGLKIDGMGARYQQLRITDSAQELLKDFNTLVNGGVPVVNVLGEMGDEVNDFIARAVAMGTEVPEKMRPMLQKFVDQGLLTDESGQKLKDLSGINFAQPLETAIQGLIDKLGELIDKIGDTGNAFAGLPNLEPSSTQDFAPDAIPMAAGGFGRVTGPTLFLAGESGPEDVAFSGAGKRFGGGSDGGVLKELRGLRSDMALLPLHIKAAVQQGVA